MEGIISHKDGFLLTDLLQMLCLSQRTGCLELEDVATEQKAFLNIKEERVLNATAGSDHDIDAISRYMTKPQVKFNFQDGLRNSEDSINLSITDLLLQCSHQIDSQTIASEKDRSPHTFYVIARGSETAEGGKSEEDNTNFKYDVDFIEYHSSRIGESLNMKVMTSAALSGPDEKISFKYVGEDTHGVRTQQPINIVSLLKLL